MRRLLLLTPVYPPALGGIEVFSQELVAGLGPRWDLTAVAPAGSDGAEVRRTRAGWHGAAAVSVLAEMGAAGRRLRPDTVLATHLFVLPAARAAARGRPVAVILHGGELWGPKARPLIRLFGGGVARFLAVSEFTRGVATGLGVPADRISVVPPGARVPERPADWEQRLAALGLLDEQGQVRPFLLTVARLADLHKGQDAVVRALPQLLARHPQLRYVAAGEGPRHAELAQLAVATGVRDAVVLPGRVDEPTKAALLSACSAYVLASRERAKFEGFGIAVAEAALAGRPAVGGRAGAVPELVLDGETGLLADADAPGELAAAIARLLDDPDYADRLGAQARERALERFTWERAVERIDAQLRELVG
jgi:phosphatidylinositol alpha-1,6-mannosyltransferase